MEDLIQIDQAITLWINRFHSAPSDQFWIFLSNIRIWFIAYGAVMAVMIRRLGWKRGLLVILSCILTVVVCDQVSAHIKDGVQRLRPLYTTAMLQSGLHWPLGRYDFFGFFSGHASNCFGFATCSWLGFRLNDPSRSYKAYGWCVFIWAALVSLSRIMVAAHFFGDILVGTLFGLSVGLLTAGLAHGAVRRWLTPVTA